ncbi:MAG: hypothetical protein AAB263_04160, partial [Planctomycetota bacterium]
MRSLLAEVAGSVEPGDRFEVQLDCVTRQGGWILLPGALCAPGMTFRAVEDAAGKAIEASFDAARSAIALTDWQRFFHDDAAAVLRHLYA